LEVLTIAHPPDKKRRLEKRERKRRQSPDGDASWRIPNDEQREHERQATNDELSSIIHLPHVEDESDSIDKEWSNGPPGTNTRIDVPANTANTVGEAGTEEAGTPSGAGSSAYIASKTSTHSAASTTTVSAKARTTNTASTSPTTGESSKLSDASTADFASTTGAPAAASTQNAADKTNTISETAISITNSHRNAENESIQPSSNYPKDEVAVDNSVDSEDSQTQHSLTNQEQARLHSLKAMLNASNARSKKASRNRPPKFSAGLSVKVLNGEHIGKVGVVLDADYIANRALISLSDQESPHWIAFKFLGYSE